MIFLQAQRFPTSCTAVQAQIAISPIDLRFFLQLQRFLLPVAKSSTISPANSLPHKETLLPMQHNDLHSTTRRSTHTAHIRGFSNRSKDPSTRFHHRSSSKLQQQPNSHSCSETKSRRTTLLVKRLNALRGKHFPLLLSSVCSFAQWVTVCTVHAHT